MNGNTKWILSLIALFIFIATGIGEQTYALISSTIAISLYGTGAPVADWTGEVTGVTNPAKIMGVAVADIKKVMGVE